MPHLQLHPRHSTPHPGTRVLQVSADDLDSGRNGQVRFRVATGALDQFAIDDVSGVLSVSNDSRGFDYDKLNRYQMTVCARSLYYSRIT